MKLYILNPTAQKLRFNFRVPGERYVRQLYVGPGQQEVVYGGNADAVNAIIKQHEVYGLIPDTDVRAKRKGYTGMIFAQDRPVDISAAKIVERMNVDALTKRGDELREASAASVVQNISSEARNRGIAEDSIGDLTAGIRGEDEEGRTVAINSEKIVSTKPGKKA